MNIFIDPELCFVTDSFAPPTIFLRLRHYNLEREGHRPYHSWHLMIFIIFPQNRLWGQNQPESN